MANLFQPIIFVSFMRNAQHYYYWPTDNPENLAYRYADSFGASPDSTLVVTSRTIRDGLDSAPLIVRGTVLAHCWGRLTFSFFSSLDSPVVSLADCLSQWRDGLL